MVLLVGGILGKAKVPIFAIAVFRRAVIYPIMYVLAVLFILKYIFL